MPKNFEETVNNLSDSQIMIRSFPCLGHALTMVGLATCHYLRINFKHVTPVTGGALGFISFLQAAVNSVKVQLHRV